MTSTPTLVVDTIGKITLPDGETCYGLILVGDCEADVRSLAHLYCERVTIQREPAQAVAAE